MIWYGVSCLVHYKLHSETHEDRDPFEYEESVLLVRAHGKLEAYDKAAAQVKASCKPYKNTYGETIEPTLVAILGVSQFLEERIKNYSEVFARFLSTEEADVLLKHAQPAPDEDE